MIFHTEMFEASSLQFFVSCLVGGVITSGLAIYDTMQYILNPISTWCVGQAASMGSLLLAAGTAGMRHSLPNARIMVHQPSGGARVRIGDKRREKEGAAVTTLTPIFVISGASNRYCHPG